MNQQEREERYGGPEMEHLEYLRENPDMANAPFPKWEKEFEDRFHPVLASRMTRQNIKEFIYSLLATQADAYNKALGEDYRYTVKTTERRVANEIFSELLFHGRQVRSEIANQPGLLISMQRIQKLKSKFNVR